jgi:exopolysaccharide biosynthesis operon protein EpsL
VDCGGKSLGLLVKKSLLQLALSSAISSFAFTSCSALAQQIDYGQPALMADHPDTFEPYVGATYSYDDNLLRTPASQMNGMPTSDTSWTREAGISFDHFYSRQHITANLDINKTTFDRYKVIDYDGKDAAFNWEWGITNDFSGVFGMNYSQSLTPFTQFHFAELNLRTQRNDYFNGIWRFSPYWQFHTGVSTLYLDYDLPSQQAGDREVHIASGGIDFVSDQGNVIGLLVQQEQGGFPLQQLIGNFYVDNNYTQNELKLNLDWTVSGLTHIQFAGGWARREYDQFTTRDVSGPSAHLNMNYIATGKTSLNLSVWRDIDESDNLTVQYTVDKAVSLAAIWDAMDKIRVIATLKRESYDYTNSALFTQLLPQNRVDTMRDASLTATYTPLRRVQTSLSVYTDQLNSTITDYNYRDKGLVLNMRMAF